jgi:Putative zinc-finger
MTEVPKIVYDRLRAALPEQAHPDADLLTAFAEQALSAGEREGVLQHLALCEDCRDVVALALPAADITPPQTADENGVRTTVSQAGSRAPRKLSLAWPTLRWAALAAGAVVAAAVLLVHPGKLNQATPPSVNQQVATAAPPDSSPKIASSIPSSSVPSSLIATSPTDQSTFLAKSDETQPRSELQLSRRLKAGQVVMPSPQAESGRLLADNKKDSGQADRLSAPADRARAFDYDARSSQVANEAVDVSGATAAVSAEPSAENALMAGNETPRKGARAIEKAKPALQEMEGSEEQKAQAAAVPGPAESLAGNVMSTAKLASPASPTQAHNVTWAIAGGVLQRSVDSGQSWQDALHADHPLLCYASRDEDVWAGGQAGTLFHSANSGATWAQVQPSVKTRQLSSDITHIEVGNNEVRNNKNEVRNEALRREVRNDVRGPGEILLSTRNHEIWTSADGGKTWAKR